VSLIRVRNNKKFITCVNDTTEKLFSGVNDTADKFIDGIVDTGDKTVLPILAFLYLKIKNKPNSIFRCKVDPTKLLAKYEKNNISKFFSFITCVIDTAGKHSFVNISANFRKNLKWS
jgi:hypothetical protein